jgi:aminoglycoside 6'-N-acetyltransferase
MKDSITDYTFRYVTTSDMSILATWLKEPRVARWFDDPDYIGSIEESLEDIRMQMRLVLYNSNPIAYVQDYDIHKWTEHHLAYLPPGSRGIDTFIGSEKWLGQGHGAKYLSLLCKMHFDHGVPAMGIDTDPKNVPARRAYEKIGFREDGVVDSEWGEVLTMSLYA